MNNCMLFKAGKSKNYKGVDCDICVVSVSNVKDKLKSGWFKTIGEVSADTNESGKLSNEEIRAAAKEAGISNYEKARISTLKDKLGYDNT